MRLRSPIEWAKRASARSVSPARAGSAGTISTSSSSPSVSVPVLSTQIVSTAASASVAAICWTSVFIRARRTAATASVTLISRTSPSGISVTSPAVAVCAASWSGVLRAERASRTRTPSGTSTMVVAQMIRLTSSCSGEGGWRKARASPATFAAWLSSRTASTS